MTTLLFCMHVVLVVCVFAGELFTENTVFIRVETIIKCNFIGIQKQKSVKKHRKCSCKTLKY